MSNYKDTNNNLYFLDDAKYIYLLPSDCVLITDEEAKAIRQAKIMSPTADQNKATASSLLSATDWTTIADVTNPQISNPYLANQADFIAYRNAIRQIAVYPVAGDLVWPVIPTEVWGTV